MAWFKYHGWHEVDMGTSTMWALRPVWFRCHDLYRVGTRGGMATAGLARVQPSLAVPGACWHPPVPMAPGGQLITDGGVGAADPLT